MAQSLFEWNFHHRLTKRELQQIFAVSHHKDVPEYELIDVNRKQLTDGTIHLLFHAWDQEFLVNLKPNLKLLSPHLNFHHRLTKRELQQIFAVSHHKDVPEYELIDVNRKQLTDGTIHLLFHAWDQEFLVNLKPNLKLLSPHLISVVRDGKKSSRSRGLPTHLKADCHFYGKVLSHDNVSAAISYCDYLTGTIIMDDHFLLLQTVPQRLRNIHQVKQHHIIYKREVSLFSNLEYTPDIQLSKLNEQSVEDEFCDVSKSVDDATGMFNKVTATAASTAAGAGPLISFVLNASIQI
ncbi:hypothetical protein LOAG_17486 [Loa loa]|uniref:Peptidase M12B propeptide domain-containing protein n=1 Tax=Loa loa TaxID=7209 RepID=A0A1S0UJ12_LOALO|nr:hypothetical protein LOAG_17486 [Loa loa]EJD75358.1 hypothetical protein LOAG_17486 [Loa loa]